MPALDVAAMAAVATTQPEAQYLMAYLSAATQPSNRTAMLLRALFVTTIAAINGREDAVRRSRSATKPAV